MLTRLRRVTVPLSLASVVACSLLGLAQLVGDPAERPAPRALRPTTGVGRERVAAPGPTRPSPAPRPERRRPQPPHEPVPAPIAAEAPTLAAPSPGYERARLSEIVALGARLRPLLHEGSEERTHLDRALTLAGSRPELESSAPAVEAPQAAALLASVDPVAEARALARAYPDSSARVRLVRLLRDQDPRARAEAALALSAWTDFAVDVLPLLDHEPDATVRRAVLSSLAERAGATAAQDLALWLRGGSRPPADVDHAVKAIREIARREGVEPPVGLPPTRRETRRLALAQGPRPAPRAAGVRREPRQRPR